MYTGARHTPNPFPPANGQGRRTERHEARKLNGRADVCSPSTSVTLSQAFTSSSFFLSFSWSDIRVNLGAEEEIGRDYMEVEVEDVSLRKGSRRNPIFPPLSGRRSTDHDSDVETALLIGHSLPVRRPDWLGSDYDVKEGGGCGSANRLLFPVRCYDWLADG